MSPLETQIGWLGRLLAGRELPVDDAAIAAGARASLEFLRKWEEPIRSMVKDIKAAEQSEIMKDARKYFPDSEVVALRRE
ncbi:MAG: hypothetical protein ACEQSB_06175 [Undibacterium sp.]